MAALLENIIPPSPSDVIVALGAFLSSRGVTQPVVVFLVTWVSSVSGAVIVYAVARRYGRGLFSGRVGQKLFSPRAVATIEREYLRFGVVGIFLGRLIPGVRSFVAPFAGLIGLGFFRAVIPMAIASGLWYGGIVWAGTVVGSEWTRIEHFITTLTRGAGLVGLALLLVVATPLIVRAIRRRRERFWRIMGNAIGQALAPGMSEDPTAMAAAATLMLELARADETLTPAELETVTGYLRQRWAMVPEPGSEKTPLLERARLMEYANEVSKDYKKAERVALVERLWEAAFSDGALRDQEERLMRHAATLLGLDENELEGVRKGAEPTAGPPGRRPAE